MDGSGLRARPRRVRHEIVRFGRTRREAEASLAAAATAVLHGADAVITRTMPLLEAGECWLEQIARPDSGLSARTIADYSWTWRKYVGATGETGTRARGWPRAPTRQPPGRKDQP